MSQQRKNSILFESGAVQVKVLMDSFFQSCLKKARAINPDILHYHPALSDFRDYDKLLSIDSPLLFSEPNSPTDFSYAKLKVLESFLRQASDRIEDGGVRLEDQRVFCEVEESADSMALYRRAFALMEYWEPWMQSLWSNVIKVIVPLCRVRDNIEDGMGFTNRNFLGGFFVSPERRRPDPLLYLNITFAHELGHQALYLYQFAGSMILEKDRWVYSGVRKVDRPAQNSLHAAMALAYMLSAIKGLKQAPLDIHQLSYLNQLHDEYREGLGLGLDALKTVKLSALGEMIVADLAEAL